MIMLGKNKVRVGTQGMKGRERKGKERKEQYWKALVVLVKAAGSLKKIGAKDQRKN